MLPPIKTPWRVHTVLLQLVYRSLSAKAFLPNLAYQSLSTYQSLFTYRTLFTSQSYLQKLVYQNCAPHTCMSSMYTTACHNIPCIMRRTVSPGTQPASMPTPGAVRRACAAFTRWALPATYPPPVTTVPPGFLIRLPMHKSAPTCATAVVTEK